MTKLKYLLKDFIDDLVLHDSVSAVELEVTGVSCDSRTVKPGELFFAIAGAKNNGQSFAQQAIKAGAVAIVASELIQELSVPIFVIPEIRKCFCVALDRFLNNPTSNKLCIAVTGTNGKTSTTWIVSRLLSLLGKPCTLVGTLGIGEVEKAIDLKTFKATNNTTPGPEVLLNYLASSLSPCAAIEATSQGLNQYRTYSVNWDAAIFSNLTHDHLDLHPSFEQYGQAKAKLFFDELSRSSKAKKIAVINIDDPFGVELSKKLKREYSHINTISISIKEKAADVYCSVNAVSAQGLSFVLNLKKQSYEFNSSLVGQFNLWNLTSALVTLNALGYSIQELQRVLSQVESVPGRLEHFNSKGINVYVDYAHTPDALDSVQRSLLELKPKRLITVFGCGGDRDKTKRPLMAKSVAQYSDIAIVTSDNPRSENPADIAEQIEQGLKSTKVGFTWMRVLNRSEAIKAAIEQSSSGDIILVAGKGHEDYQEVNGVKYPFDDRVEVQKALS